MAEVVRILMTIIWWIWTQLNRPFNSPDSQVLVSAPSSSGTLPSSSTATPTRWKYDVFLSFRGLDTRKGITSEIRDRLQSRGIRTFMDDRDLESGDPISRKLIEAIEESRFAVVVLSHNYAFSTWWLEELAKIWECMANEDRIFPLFYGVDPTEVRYQKKGSFKEAFFKHETSGRHKPEIVKQWTAALQGVGNISGWNTDAFRTHRELVDNIVESLRCKVPPDAIVSTDDFQAYEATTLAMDEVKEALRDDQITVVGVYGMGGVGKRTMVRHVVAEACINDTFNNWIIATVSQDPNFKQIQGTLSDKLRFKFVEETEDGRADRLHDEIMRREKLLIILDDVWNIIDMSRIGIPSFKKLQTVNSKVLLTTRISNVCHVMECQRTITLNILSKEDSWALFEKKARRCFESPTFEGVAKKVAEECGGLPIALITVARALGDKDLVEWERAAEWLMKSQTASPDHKGEAFECIRLSYDYLKNEEYKSYFLLCCLFPEDYDIRIDNLFKYALGQGLFRDADTLKEARGRADSLARHLQNSCLLLGSVYKGYVRMHDVVRDATIQIAQSEHGFLVKAGCGLEDWPRQLHEDYSAISLMKNHISKLPENLECPKLRILSLYGNSKFIEIPETFFQSPNELRVLDLSWTRCTSLRPQSFSLLTNLQALYLDECEYRRVDNSMLQIDTSMLGELKKLEILSMRDLCLKELSIELGGLTNLRLFDNTGGRIAGISPNVISKWHNLEELYIQGFGGWGSKTNAGFDEVIGLSKLKILVASISDVECIPKNVDIIPCWVKLDIHIGRLMSNVWRHDRTFSGLGCVTVWLNVDKLSRLPEWFRNEIMKKADKLRWVGCKSLIDIVVEDEHGRLPGLKQLQISWEGQSYREVDPTITRVPKKPVFENLEELVVDDGEDYMELFAAVELLPTGSLFNLKVLKVVDCYDCGTILVPSTTLQRLPNLEYFSVHGTNADYVFKYDELRPLKLERMCLSRCSAVGICEGRAPPTMFQNLQTLNIWYCKFEGSLFIYDVT